MGKRIGNLKISLIRPNEQLTFRVENNGIVLGGKLKHCLQTDCPYCCYLWKIVASLSEIKIYRKNNINIILNAIRRGAGNHEHYPIDQGLKKNTGVQSDSSDFKPKYERLKIESPSILYTILKYQAIQGYD